MYKSVAIAALLGNTMGGKVPVKRVPLTADQYHMQKHTIESKYLGGEHIDVKDFMNTQYFIEVEVGTPGQKFTVVPDTGSSNLWMYAKGCHALPCWYHSKFDNTKSSTYKKDGQAFDIVYGSGSVNGTVGSDVVKIGDDITATMGFGEITKVKGVSFDVSQMDGILGLAYDTISVDHLKTFVDNDNMTDKSFSMYLNLNPNDSYMMMPGWDTENYNTIDTHKVVEEKYWALQLDSIAQGDKKIDASKYKGVIDSGTSILVGPKEIVDPFIEGITVSPDCSGIDQLPELSFTLDGTKYPLSPSDYVLKVESPLTKKSECILAVQSMAFPEGFNYFIIGDTFMRKYPTLFNPNDNTVSFQVAKSLY